MPSIRSPVMAERHQIYPSPTSVSGVRVRLASVGLVWKHPFAVCESKMSRTILRSEFWPSVTGRGNQRWEQTNQGLRREASGAEGCEGGGRILSLAVSLPSKP